MMPFAVPSSIVRAAVPPVAKVNVVSVEMPANAAEPMRVTVLGISTDARRVP